MCDKDVREGGVRGRGVGGEGVSKGCGPVSQLPASLASYPVTYPP